MNRGLEFAQKTALAYHAVCKPLCQKLGLTQTAFDILMTEDGLDFRATTPAAARRATSLKSAISRPIWFRSM